jgi:hypothetical protein
VDKFEMWLAHKIDELEKKLKSAPSLKPPNEAYTRVFGLVYSFGRDILLDVLKVYRKHRAGKDISKD